MSRFDRDVPFLATTTTTPSHGHDLARRMALRLRARSLAGIGMLPEAAADDSELAYEDVFERSNLLPAWFLKVGAARARAICKLSTSGVNYRGQSGSWAGTGFLIAKDILLTNCHVLNSADVARNGTAIFSFEDGEGDRPTPTRQFRLDPDRLFLTSPVRELDYAFVWVEGEPGREYGHVPLSRSALAVVENDFINIIQHPEGGPKEVALQENTVSRATDVVIHYTTDTMPGSSGACAFDNRWKPVALHHARREENGVTRNEGILLSAIAAHLDKLAEHGAGTERLHARTILRAFDGTDEKLGFFGSLGRSYQDESAGTESTVQAYRGGADDLDVASWNVEWFCKTYREKVARVAEVIVKMNVDVWSLVESSPAAARALVGHLKDQYGLSYDWAASEPGASEGKQSTTVIWNCDTVTGRRIEWPEQVTQWLSLRSDPYEPGDLLDLGLEAEDGRIFDRYPGLFQFSVSNREAGQEPFSIYLVPLHLKAMDEGSKRRQLACEVITAAIDAFKRSRDHEDHDWVVLGDFNAELASGDFKTLADRGLVPMAADDAGNGGFTYLKRPRSLIDHVYLSANLARKTGAAGYFIVAEEKELPRYVKDVSDHRPVVVRLSLHDKTVKSDRMPVPSDEVVASLRGALEDLHQRKRPGQVRRGRAVPPPTTQTHLGGLSHSTPRSPLDAVR